MSWKIFTGDFFFCRLAATSSLANINDDLQTKDVNSIKNSKPIIISIKKGE